MSRRQKSIAWRRSAGVGLICLTGLGSNAPVRAQAVFPLAGPDESAFADACGALNQLELPELVAIQARWNPAGPTGLAELNDADLTPPILAAHCRVRGRIEPAIQFEVWLPEPTDWNGRFLGVGGGGFAGSISYRPMAMRLNQGYATASTDTGHAEGAYDWLADDTLLRDFAYRAIYEMTSKAGVIVADFYDRPADYNYFNGCSLGGRQGLMEAQHFPDDYDGIVAGAPVNAFIETRTTQLWATRAAQPAANGQSLLDAGTLGLLTASATAECDTLDGVADGVIEDPRRCNFDARTLQCGFASPGRCLTAQQAAAVQSIYQGPAHPDTGPIAPGFAVGSESGWTFATSPNLASLTDEFFSRVVFEDPLWNWRSFDFVTDYSLAQQAAGWLLNATSPDLSEFRDRGGKLLLYHGWNDSNNAPEATIGYFEAVETALAVAPNPRDIAIPDFARLFMVPGMAHCAGGIGTSEFDAQQSIESWVERGIAPDRIEAERIDDGQVIRTRPLCPYPQTARYRGTGNSDRSGSFVCTE
jgi:feruloyl esterase